MNASTKKCPYCAEEINVAAIKCKHCGEMLEPKTVDPTMQIKEETQNGKLKKSTLFSIGLLISFFLPWFSIFLFNLSGYNIPVSMDRLVSTSDYFDADFSILKISYILYLIPICSSYNIFKDLTNAKSRYLLNEFAIGLLCIILLFCIVKSSNNDSYSFSIGYYSTLFFSVLGFISTNKYFIKLFDKERS